MRRLESCASPSAAALLAVTIIAMPIGESPVRGQCTEVCTAIHTLEGEVAGDQFGWVSNSVGDLDGDQIQDFVITAPTNDEIGTNSGKIYVYSGADASEIFSATGQALWRLGNDAAGAGDIDGDRTPDVIAGAPNSGAGRARVYSGANGSIIHTFDGEASGDAFGYRVWGGGDFDGDKHADVIIGARLHDTAGFNAGRAYVYSGSDFSLICSIDGGSAGDFLGSGVAFIGDVNGDGRDDAVVGAQNAGAGSVGRAYVYSWNGKSCVELYELIPPGTATNFGLWFMNGEHDVNGDGTPDVYVNDFGANRAHVFSGVDGALIWTLSGDNNGGFGIGRIVEDVDGDCFADMILAAWASNAGAPCGGKGFVYSGRTGAVLDTYTHDVNGAKFGFDANGMGDVDGDGTFDYLITAASDLSARGRCYVIAGEIAPPAIGDLDGDQSVSVTDLLDLLAGWGPCPDPPAACPGDLDCDRSVSVTDLLALLANWG